MTLHGFEMEFYPVPFAFGIDEAVGMGTIAVELAEIAGQPTIAHQNGYLMERLRGKAPEIPGGGVIPHIGLGIALLGMNEIGKL
jgi:hypothetical protein